MLPLLKRCADGQEHPLIDFRATLSKDMDISEEDLAEKLPSGTQTKYENRIYWSAIYLYKAGALSRIRRGVFQITERGKQLLVGDPIRISINAEPVP